MPFYPSSPPQGLVHAVTLHSVTAAVPQLLPHATSDDYPANIDTPQNLYNQGAAGLTLTFSNLDRQKARLAGTEKIYY